MMARKRQGPQYSSYKWAIFEVVFYSSIITVLSIVFLGTAYSVYQEIGAVGLAFNPMILFGAGIMAMLLKLYLRLFM